MKKLTLNSLLILCTLFLFTECKRTLDNSEFFGPELSAAPAGFQINPWPTSVFTATQANAGFDNQHISFGNYLGTANDTIIFTAGFSHKVTWTVTITGAQGAVKTLSGTGDTMAARWDGTSSNIYFFRKNEDVVAELSIVGWPTTYTISNLKLHPSYGNINYNRVCNTISSTIIDNFDPPRGAPKPLISKYSDAGDLEIVSGLSSAFSVEGNYSYRLAGRDVNNNSWLTGINTEFLDSWYNYATHKSNYVVTTDPNNLYFNIYIYGTGKANSSIQLKAYEVDVETAPPYNQALNDGYVFGIIVNWTGWKLVSVRYSDFRKASDPNLGGNGNAILEPNKISGMDIELLSQPTVGASVDIYMDMLTLTEGGPFNPNCPCQ